MHLDEQSIKKTPLLSIIMPVYNCENYLAQAVGSIINQSYTNWELLICDDGSSDNSWDIIRKLAITDERVTAARNDGNKGKVDTVNCIFKKCKGDFITIHDADDWSELNRFDITINFLNQNPDIYLVGSQTNIVNYKGRLIRQDKRTLDDTTIQSKIWFNNQFCGATTVFRRKALTDNYIYREFFKNYNYEDYDLTFRITQKFKVANLANFLYNYRQHPNSLSKRITINNLISKEIVCYLANQRKEKGFDDLEKGLTDNLETLVKELRQPLENDKSLLYRKYSETFMFVKLYKKAVITSFSAIRKEPFKWINYRTFQYCLRVSIFNFFKSTK